MVIQDLNFKAALLLSPENRAVQEAMPNRGNKRGSLSKVLGISDTTLNNWLRFNPDNGGGAPQESAIVRLIDSLSVLKIELTTDEFSELSIFEFGKKFGMRREQTQKAIDVVMDVRPRINQQYLMDKDSSKIWFEHLSGVYSVFVPVHSVDVEEVSFMCCALRVRYAYELAGTNVSAIKCKLNVPSFRRDSFYNYTGNVISNDYSEAVNANRNSIYHWHFEQGRQPDEIRPDVITMNSYFEGNETNTMKGLLLSVNQDAQRVGYAAKFYASRHASINNDFTGVVETDDAIDHMRLAPRPIASLDQLREENEGAFKFFKDQSNAIIVY